MDLVSKVCGGIRVCSDEQMAEVLKAQNELQQAVDENAIVVVKAGGIATVAGAGAIVAPGITTAWGLGTLYDYVGDVISYSMGLSQDGPNLGKSMAVGGVAAATSPFFLPLGTLGGSTAGKIVVGGYNSLWAGTGAFGATAITQSGSPDLCAGVGTAGAMLGMGIQATMPGPIGMSINQLLQILSGPTQAGIESGKRR